MLDIFLNHFIEIILGFIITFLTYMYKKLVNYNRMIKFVRDGVKVLLKTKIIEQYNYHKKQGSITIFDKQIISDLYSEYHNLGGNGVITDLIDDINSLPISNDYNMKKTILKE